jgi:hypothetical protein
MHGSQNEWQNSNEMEGKAGQLKPTFYRPPNSFMGEKRVSQICRSNEFLLLPFFNHKGQPISNAYFTSPDKMCKGEKSGLWTKRIDIGHWTLDIGQNAPLLSGGDPERNVFLNRSPVLKVAPAHILLKNRGFCS